MSSVRNTIISCVLVLLLICLSNQNVCEHPLTKECDAENNKVLQCADNAVVMWLRADTCRCRVGFYFAEAKDDQPAMCVKCDEICKDVCRGPATRTIQDGKEVLTPNDNCPEIAPDALLPGDIQSDEEMQKNEYEKRHRFYLFGKPCYTYVFDDLYFYLPNQWVAWRVKQDYNLENYPARENRYITLRQSGVPWKDHEHMTSCKYLYQSGIFYGGVSLLEIKDFIGESRAHTSVDQYIYWTWKGDWLAYGDSFNLLAIMHSSNLVVAASPQVRILLIFRIVFEPWWNTDAEEYLETEYYPMMLLELDGKNALILWDNSPYRTVLRASYQGSYNIDYQKASNIIGREMSSDYNKFPLVPEDDPKIVILFGENKIELLKSPTFEQERVITIVEWSDEEKDSSVFGTVLFLPNSDFVVAAKMGERKIVFKKYLSDDQTESSHILTVFDKMHQIMVPERHKLLVVFDQELDVIAYYSLSKFIGCPPDKNIRSCSSVLVYENIECFKNHFWNPVTKKCECAVDFYFDAKSQACEKCNCKGFQTQCFSSPTDCNEEPYFRMAFNERHTVVDGACMTKGKEGNSQLQVWDGQFGAQYTVDLRFKQVDWFRSFSLPSMNPEQGKVKISCQWDFFISSNRFNNFYQTPKSSMYKDHERFLFPSKGQIDVVHIRNQFYPWMIFSSSSTSEDEESIPTTVFMQDNEDSYHQDFMIVDLEFVYVEYPHIQYFGVGEPVSAMTTIFGWGEPPIFQRVFDGKKNFLQVDYLVCAPNSKDSQFLKVFKIIEAGRVIRENDTLMEPIFELPKLEGDIYKKMALIKRSDEDQILYSITQGKKIVITDFLNPSGLTIHQIKSFTSESEEIRTAEYLERTTYFLACNNVDSCAVIDFYDETRADRLILVGSGYSQISVVKTAKFFIATYPKSNSLGLFFLEEVACARQSDKGCDNLDILKATECYPNSRIHPHRAECICEKQHYFDNERFICLPCHDSCPFKCTGPGEEDCTKFWYYDNIAIMRHNYQCYDHPAQWYNVESGLCECFDGYIPQDGGNGESYFCSKCPSQGCLSCDSSNLEVCLNCQSGYLLIEGKCLDCTSLSFENENCPLSYSFSKWHDGKLADTQVPDDVFDINERMIGLSGAINGSGDDWRYNGYWVSDVQGNWYFYDFIYIDLYYPAGGKQQREDFFNYYMVDGDRGYTFGQVPEWNIANLVEFYATVEGGVDMPLKWKASNYDRDGGNPQFSFYFDFSQKLDKEVNKKIKMVIKNHIIFPKEVHRHSVFLRGGELTWDVVGGVSTSIPKEDIVKPEPLAPSEDTANQTSVGQVAGKAAVAVALFALKYFVIVDIMINFMGKVNITLSPLLGKYVNDIKSAELPNISFVEVTSPISDGGGKMKEEYTDQKEKEKEELIEELNAPVRNITRFTSEPKKNSTSSGLNETKGQQNLVPKNVPFQFLNKTINFDPYHRVLSNLDLWGPQRFLNEQDTFKEPVYIKDEVKNRIIPPESFFAFEELKNSSRVRLLKGNQDLFLIWGQNGIIAAFIVISYIAVWIFKIGTKKNVLAKLYVFLLRNLFFVFFIKFQMISFTELGCHNLVRPQKNFLRVSFILSMIFNSLLNIELIRAWLIVKKGYSDKQLEDQEFDLEVKWMFNSWTADLKPKEKLKGNTYMIRDRIRWSLFQLCVAGLQSFEVAQIICITLVDIIYFVIVIKDIKGQRTFKNFGVKLKYVFQETAILTFLVVLTVFGLVKSPTFRETKFFSFLEWVVIVGVGVAIGAELIAVFWTITAAIKTFWNDFKMKKLVQKMTVMEKELRMKSEEDDLGLRRLGTVSDPLRRFTTRRETGRKRYDFNELLKNQPSEEKQQASNEDKTNVLPWKKGPKKFVLGFEQDSNIYSEKANTEEIPLKVERPKTQLFANKHQLIKVPQPCLQDDQGMLSKIEQTSQNRICNRDNQNPETQKDLL